MAALKPNSIAVFNVVKEATEAGENITAADIAERTGLEVKSVNGIVTSAFQRKELMERIPAEMELEDGTHKAIKLIRMTEKGMAFDVNQTE